MATPAISAPQDRIVGEADGGLDFDVTLNAPGLSTVTVNFSLFGGGCNAAFQQQVGTLTFAPGETVKTVHGVLNECNAVTDFSEAHLVLSAQTNATIARNQTQINVVDDDTIVGTPRLQVRGVAVDEKDGQALVSVMMGGAAGQVSGTPVTVDYATSNDTATAGSDFTAKSGTFTFDPGQTVKTIAVPITDDAAEEPAERFNVTLSNPSGASISDPTAIVEIGASDAPATAAPRISVGQDMIVGEADGFADLPIRLSAPSDNAVTVRFSAIGGGCNSPSLGRGQNGITFNPGETVKTLRVTLNQCLAVTALSRLYLTLDTPSAPATIARGQLQLDLVDNDTLAATPKLYVRGVTVDEKADVALVSVLMGGPAGQFSGSTVTVDYATSNDSATAGSDYVARSGSLTFAPGQNVKTIAVPIVDDAVNEPAERFKVSLSSASGASISDGTDLVEIGASDAPETTAPAISVGPDIVAGEADGYVDLPITLSAPSPDAVTIRFSAIGGGCNSPTAGRGQAGLTFLPGETTMTLRVDLNECNAATGFSWFFLTLDTPGAPAALGHEELMLNVVDNDTLVATPKLVVRGTTVDEKAGKALIPVMLGGPEGQKSGNTVTVDYATSNDTATAGSDYTARSGSLTFAPGQTEKTIAVPIADDGSPEPAERFNVTLANASGATITGGSDSVEIGASDASAVVKPAVSAPADQIASSDDGFVDFPVRLSAPSAEAVDVDWGVFTGGAGCNADAVQRVGTLRFLPGETVQTARVILTNCFTSSYFHTITFQATGVSANATIARANGRAGIVDDGVSLSSLDVTPASPHVAIGANQQFTATGTFSDALVVDLTSWVTWTSASTPVATVNGAGLAHGVSAGQSTITGTLGQTGPPWSSVTGSGPLTVDGAVGPTAQTITFGALAGKTFGDADFTVSATATSGLPVAFAAEGACTVTVATVHLTGAGNCKITASQAGNVTYSAATPVERSFTVSPAAQMITFGSLAGKTFGDGDFTVGATATSGLPVAFAAAGACTVTGGTVHLTGAGTCTITASQAGNANYAAATPVDRTFSVGKAAQTITFGALAGKAFGAADFTVSATASSELPVAFAASGSCAIAGATVHLTAAGTCTITASQAGNANYLAAAPVDRAFSVGKDAQTITFAAIADKVVGDADFKVSPTASSGLTVTVSASGPCNVSALTVHVSAAGTCTLTASQPGNSNFAGAANVARSFTITQKAAGKTCTVPGVFGLKLASAKEAIVRRRCHTGVIRRAYSRRVVKGRVVSQSPKAGAVVPEGATVNLTVSKGRRHR